MKCFLILLFFVGMAGVGYAADDVWIEPGSGIGVIRIGDSYDTVIQKLGRPSKPSGVDPIAGSRLDYPDWHIEMSNLENLREIIEKGRKNAADLQNPVAVDITTYNPKAKTRGNLSIGSSLKDVLNVFGNTSPKIDYASKKNTMRTCARMSAARLPEGEFRGVLKDDFNGYILSIHYYEGITFFFKIDDQIPSVFAISATQRNECTLNELNIP